MYFVMLLYVHNKMIGGVCMAEFILGMVIGSGVGMFIMALLVVVKN